MWSACNSFGFGGWNDEAEEVWSFDCLHVWKALRLREEVPRHVFLYLRFLFFCPCRPYQNVAPALYTEVSISHFAARRRIRLSPFRIYMNGSCSVSSLYSTSEYHLQYFAVKKNCCIISRHPLDFWDKTVALLILEKNPLVPKMTGKRLVSDCSVLDSSPSAVISLYRDASISQKKRYYSVKYRSGLALA